MNTCEFAQGGLDNAAGWLSEASQHQVEPRAFIPGLFRRFDIPEKKEEFFSSAERSQIVNFILRRQAIPNPDDTEEAKIFGVDRLVKEGVYKAAYPLHEGSTSDKEISLRNRLITGWASVERNVLFKPQPLDEIKQYFGVKIAMYFTWLGFYTYMLLPLSIFGILSLVYGVTSTFSTEPT